MGAEQGVQAPRPQGAWGGQACGAGCPRVPAAAELVEDCSRRGVEAGRQTTSGCCALCGRTTCCVCARASLYVRLTRGTGWLYTRTWRAMWWWTGSTGCCAGWVQPPLRCRHCNEVGIGGSLPKGVCSLRFPLAADWTCRSENPKHGANGSASVTPRRMGRLSGPST